MKTYFDLTKKERNEFFKEFKKNPVGKEMNFSFICTGVLAGVCWFVVGFVSGLQDGSGIAMTHDTELFITVIAILALFALLIFAGFAGYINISFSAWLKNKHNIKKW